VATYLQYRWVGVSTEAKPTITNVPPPNQGDLFDEQDTGNRYWWDAGSQVWRFQQTLWAPGAPPLGATGNSNQDERLETLITEIRALRWQFSAAVQQPFLDAATQLSSAGIGGTGLVR